MIRLSTMSDKKRADYMQYYNDVLLSGKGGMKIEKPQEGFDRWGLKFDISYLNQIGYNVIFFPLEILAEYADAVTKSFIDEDNSEFIYKQCIDFDFPKDKEIDLNGINATALGNCAYIALNCNNAVASKQAEDFLDKVFVKAKGIMLNYMNENL